MEQLKLQFLIRITEGTSVFVFDEKNFPFQKSLYIEDFPCQSPLDGFIIELDELEIDSLYDEFVWEYYPDCNIPDPTFLIFPIINDEVLNIDLSEDIEPNGLLISDIEIWLKSKEPLQWLRTYQINKLLKKE
jgi:hypothetical protein